MRQLAARLLQELGLAGEVEAEQVQEQEHQGPEHRPEVLAEDQPLVGRQELETRP